VTGNQASFVVMMLQLGLATTAGIRSFVTARDPVSRAQMRWILWGAGVAFTVVIPGYVLPLMLIGRPLLPHPITMLFTIIILYVCAIAIFRYRLFDIEIIINRTLVYATLTVLLVSLYVILVRLLTLLFQTLLGGEDDTLIVFTAALGIALAFDPLRRRVQALIDRMFYRAKLDYQRMLTEMAEKVAASIVLDQLTALLTQELPRRLQIAWATLAVLDSPGKQFILTNGDREQLILPMDHPLITYLQSLRQPLLRLQPPPHLPVEAQGFLDQQHIELSIPLIASTEQVGLYNLGPKLSGDIYNREEIRLLHLMGRQAAVAVENSRLFQAEQEQHKLSEALQEAADVVSSTLALDQVLDRILEQVERVVKGDAFNVMLIKEGWVNVVRWRGYERLGVGNQIAGFSVPVAEYSTLSRMIQTGRPIIVQNTFTDPDWILQEGWEKLQSYVSAPIQVTGQTVGFLNVDGTRPGQFGPADAQRLEAFAYHAATAMQNARLYEQAQQEIAERKQAEEQIKTSLKEKEVLLKEIHHRVKNNLQVISSLLYLQSKQIDNKKILGMFQESQHRVRSMALIHERLYQTEDLASVDFDEYLHQLASYLFRSYGATSNLIQLNISASHVSLGIDAAIPCGLIVNELVSNSLKHAFVQGQPGEILIEISVDREGQHRLVIKDNGVGLPDRVNLDNTRSLGLQLVSTLVNQLEGSIKVERENGTRFEITFTDPSYQDEESR
jgi:two-component sensor histidine kinase